MYICFWRLVLDKNLKVHVSMSGGKLRKKKSIPKERPFGAVF
jgi:hypothetical protein